MRPRAALNTLVPYVPGKSAPGGIKLSSNENSLGPSPLALQALADGANRVNRYPDGGIHDLRAALSKLWNVDKEMIIVGNGSDEIMVMLAAAFMEPEENAITSEHTFSQYTFASKVFGGQMRYAPMRDGRYQLAEITKLVDDHTRFLFLCNPNNPTGTAFTHDELAEFLQTIRRNTIVVVDEAYAEYAASPDFPRTMEFVFELDNVIVLRTFSKIYGLAGLRVGYGIGNSELVEQLWKVRQPFNVGTLAQVAATAALSDTEFVESSLRMNRAGKQRLARGLTDLGVGFFPTEANFVCADLGSRAEEVVSGLMQRGIAIRPLNSFGLPQHVRITIGTSEEIESFLTALAELLE